PVVGINAGATVAEGGTVTIDATRLSAADPDDSGVGLTYTVTGGLTNGQLELTTNPAVPITSFTQDDLDNGRVVYVHDDSETTADSFTFSLADGGEDGSTPATGTFNLTITPVNDHSVTAVSDTDGGLEQVLENATVGTTIGITASASDADAGDNVSYSLHDNDGGRFQIDSVSGVVSVAGAIDREADGATRFITVRATSDDGSFQDRVFSIAIGDVDEFDAVGGGDVDIASNQIPENATLGDVVGITVAAGDADATINAITHAMLVDAGGRFQVDPGTGVITVASGAVFDYLSENSINVSVRSTSADGSFVDQAFTIAVLNSNDTPVAFDDAYSGIVSQPLTLSPDLAANDTDLDSDPLNVVIVVAPQNGTLTVLTDGTLIYQPHSGFFGQDTFTYQADDGIALSNIATVTIDVAGVAGGGSGGSGDSGSGGSGAGSGSDGSSSSDPPPADDPADGDTDSDAGDGDDSADGGSDPPAESATSTETAADAQQPGLRSSSGFGRSARTINGTGASNTSGSDAVGVNAIAASDDANGQNARTSEFSTAIFERQLGRLVVDQIAVDDAMRFELEHSISWDVWQQLTESEEMELHLDEITIGAVGTSVGLASIGYVLWALRGGALLATIAAGIPSWRLIDPTALLLAHREGVRKDDPLEELMGR
ncbi:MAG: cadherin-like domain-containing protein, partial [Planctomycetota bacterium]